MVRIRQQKWLYTDRCVSKGSEEALNTNSLTCGEHRRAALFDRYFLRLITLTSSECLTHVDPA